MHVEPFSIDVEEAVLDDLRERLRARAGRARRPASRWAQGTDLAYLRELARVLGSTASTGARTSARSTATRSSSPTSTACACTSSTCARGGIAADPHPRLAERVRRAAAAGRAACRGFDLVIPSLPGYGFSERPPAARRATSPRSGTALMQGLGYERYGAGGGDWGAARRRPTWRSRRPSALLGIHLSNLDNAAAAGRAPLTAAERAFVAATEHWDATERGYSFIQGTKPQTLAYGLTDSPAGLAAWILEKWRSWGDTGGDLEARFDRDFLLDARDALLGHRARSRTSIRDYLDNRDAGTADARPGRRRDGPTAIANFHCNFVSEGVAPARVGRAALRRRALHGHAARRPLRRRRGARTCSRPTSPRSSALSPGRRRSASGRRPCAARAGSRRA